MSGAWSEKVDSSRVLEVGRVREGWQVRLDDSNATVVLAFGLTAEEAEGRAVEALEAMVDLLQAPPSDDEEANRGEFRLPYLDAVSMRAVGVLVCAVDDLRLSITDTASREVREEARQEWLNGLDAVADLLQGGKRWVEL